MKKVKYPDCIEFDLIVNEHLMLLESESDYSENSGKQNMEIRESVKFYKNALAHV
jgi:hypothetical protein